MIKKFYFADQHVSEETLLQFVNVSMCKQLRFQFKIKCLPCFCLQTAEINVYRYMMWLLFCKTKNTVPLFCKTKNTVPLPKRIQTAVENKMLRESVDIHSKGGSFGGRWSFIMREETKWVT